MSDGIKQTRKQRTNMITTKQVRITPEMAADMLQKNTHNRKVRDKHVTWLASMMSAGKWKFNGDTICVNGNVLIDGQHRLMAIVKSKVPIETIIVSGLPSDVFDTKDCCTVRTGADTLHMTGVESANCVAASLRVVADMTHGSPLGPNAHLSNQVLEELLKEHPLITESVKMCRTTKCLPPSVAAGCHYMFAKKSKEQADMFIGGLLSGIGLASTSPIYILREKLISHKHGNSTIDRKFLIWLVVKAWKAFRSGKSPRSVMMPKDGSPALPEIV